MKRQNGKANGLDKKMKEVRNELTTMPDGKLHIVHDRNAVRWYNYLGKNIREYLNKSNIGLVRKLARKYFLSLLLKDLENEKHAVDFYLRHHVKIPWKSEQLLSNEDYQQLLYPSNSNENQNYHAWAQEPYQRNLEYPQNHFTIRHPQTGEYYYLEHLGRFDDSRYRQKNCNRIHIYGFKGIYPSFNLLLTYETNDMPLDIEKVEKIKRNHFWSLSYILVPNR